jgi:hypothetical protein
MRRDTSAVGEELPEPVREMLNHAYWRFDIRPSSYRSDRISFARLEPLLHETQVRLRGWYFPHLTTKTEQIIRRNNYFGGWSAAYNYEYLRFYESANLFLLRGVREDVDPSWRATLERDTRSHLSYANVDWNRVKGFLDIINFLYNCTEAFEWAARLAEALDLAESVDVSIKLANIQGFILTAAAGRSWDYEYRWDDSKLEHTWTLPAESIHDDPAGAALEAVVWFFQHFGWRDPSASVLRGEQEAFLSKRS